ncbi:MAG: hypothetical protein EXQ86_01745 [Rhodospirillales bacterium]|nr:hypothetical protein [Rhodospirillales bacterium]
MSLPLLTGGTSVADLWFKAKRYGWGWTPATWQGWAVTIFFVVAFTAWLTWWVNGEHDPLGMLPLLALTAGLILVCWKKGERPRWQWGGER